MIQSLLERMRRTHAKQPYSQSDTALERGVFITTTLLTFIEEQLLWDGQFITYPLFKRIRDLDEPAFVQVHQAYVKSLGLPTYLPSSLYLFSTLLFMFIRPRRIPVGYPLLMNLLNLIAVISTFSQLVPNHVRIDTEGHASAAQVQQLVDDNRIRFALVAINSGIMLYLLGQMLRPEELARDGSVSDR